ncbi:MAG: gliding motility-associated C-terminal domain-containing protein, partial [Bacteroidota bacterium]
ICENKTLVLNPGVSLSAAYLWQDNSTDTTFLVSEPGTFWVEVTTNICKLRDTINVSTRECDVILELPNVITPNGDGRNDLFIPMIRKGIVSMNTTIYSRWGNKVFETDGTRIEWTGEKAMDGLYFWIINYTDINGEENTLKGNLTVLK